MANRRLIKPNRNQVKSIAVSPESEAASKDFKRCEKDGKVTPVKAEGKREKQKGRRTK